MSMKVAQKSRGRGRGRGQKAVEKEIVWQRGRRGGGVSYYERRIFAMILPLVIIKFTWAMSSLNRTEMEWEVADAAGPPISGDEVRICCCCCF